MSYREELRKRMGIKEAVIPLTPEDEQVMDEALDDDSPIETLSSRLQKRFMTDAEEEVPEIAPDEMPPEQPDEKAAGTNEEPADRAPEGSDEEVPVEPQGEEPEGDGGMDGDPGNDAEGNIGPEGEPDKQAKIKLDLASKILDSVMTPVRREANEIEESDIQNGMMMRKLYEYLYTNKDKIAKFMSKGV